MYVNEELRQFFKPRALQASIVRFSTSREPLTGELYNANHGIEKWEQILTLRYKTQTQLIRYRKATSDLSFHFAALEANQSRILSSVMMRIHLIIEKTYFGKHVSRALLLYTKLFKHPLD